MTETKKLYISADIEGVAGVVGRAQQMETGFEWPLARQWFTNEVKACCEAAMSKGFNQIVISDSHGCGQNLLLDDLPEDVKVVRSWPRPLEMMEGIQEGQFDAAILLGYHAGSTDLKGGMAHTISGVNIHEVTINDQIASETVISAATAGHFNVPIIMATGDDGYHDHIRTVFGDIPFAETKQTVGQLSANTLMPKKSCELISNTTKLAIEQMADRSIYKIDGPIKLIMTFKKRLSAELLSMLSIVERVDAYSIKVECKDMIETSKFICLANVVAEPYQ